jgi:DNA-binding protein Fis
LRAILRHHRSDDALARALAGAGLRVERVPSLTHDALGAADLALVDPRLLEGGARPAEPVRSSGAAETLEDVCYERLAPILDRIGSERVPDLERAVIEATERALLRLAVERTDCLSDAATLLGVHRNTLARRLEALGLRARQRRENRPRRPARRAGSR